MDSDHVVTRPVVCPFCGEKPHAGEYRGQAILDVIACGQRVVADLTAQCPNLNLEASQFEIVPYLLGNVSDLVE